MLRSTKDLEHYKIGATDGEIGRVKDFYFDDDAWAIRFLVVDTGSWLMDRKVLISPISIREPNWLERTLPVSITREEVRNSPDIETDKPVSRQYESLYLGYYSYGPYWGGEGLWGEGMVPYALAPGYVHGGSDRRERELEEQGWRSAERERRRNEDPHLRSCNEVVGYHLVATDGEIGHVAGFLLDDETWAIRYLVVDTSNWWLGHKVLIAPRWLKEVSWGSETVSVDLSRESIKAAPPYVAGDEWSMERDARLYEHYGKRWYGPAVESFAAQF
jgi:uncharacterized protein YrrD